jgi:ParB/RepB/Spo0J family partition protein
MKRTIGRSEQGVVRQTFKHTRSPTAARTDRAPGANKGAGAIRAKATVTGTASAAPRPDMHQFPPKGAVFPVPLSELEVPDGRRTIDTENVRTLAASMKAIGLQTPITVVPHKVGATSRVVLVAGLHRVEAAKALGWESIPALLMVGGGNDHRRWQIEENLIRADLIALDRAEAIADWVRLIEPSVSGQNVQQSPGRPTGGIAQAARSLPVPGPTEEARRKVVERAIKIDRISDEAKAMARAFGIADKQSALIAVARKPTEATQIAKVRELADRDPKRQSPQPTPPAGSENAPDLGNEPSPDNPPERGGNKRPSPQPTPPAGSENAPDPGANERPSGQPTPPAGSETPPDAEQVPDLAESAPASDGDQILAQFRDAWQLSEVSKIWVAAAPEIQARIVKEILQYQG